MRELLHYDGEKQRNAPRCTQQESQNILEIVRFLCENIFLLAMIRVISVLLHRMRARTCMTVRDCYLQFFYITPPAVSLLQSTFHKNGSVQKTRQTSHSLSTHHSTQRACDSSHAAVYHKVSQQKSSHTHPRSVVWRWTQRAAAWVQLLSSCELIYCGNQHAFIISWQLGTGDTGPLLHFLLIRTLLLSFLQQPAAVCLHLLFSVKINAGKLGLNKPVFQWFMKGIWN